MLRSAWCKNCKKVRQIEVCSSGGQVCAFCGSRVEDDSGAKDGFFEVLD